MLLNGGLTNCHQKIPKVIEMQKMPELRTQWQFNASTSQKHPQESPHITSIFQILPGALHVKTADKGNINKLYICICKLTKKYISLKISILNLSCFLAVPLKVRDMELRQQCSNF